MEGDRPVRMPTTFTALEVAPLSVIGALVASGFAADRSERRTRTVLDTFDGRLHDAGLRLEVHQGGHDELVLWGDPTSPPAVLAATGVPGWPADLPPGPLRQRIAAVTRERALVPVATMSSHEHVLRRVDRRGKAAVQVSVHDEIVVDGAEPSLVPGWAAEVRAVLGHEDAAELTAARLAALGLTLHEGDLTGVVARAAGIPLGGRSSSPTVDMGPHDEALVAYRRVLLNLALTIDANLSGTIADTDPEFLHELRVAVRRTRSVLSQSKGVVPPAIRDRFGAAFAEIGQLTGPPRDLDVYLLGWADQIGSLSAADVGSLEAVRRELAARRVAAKRELARALRSRATRTTLERWRAWLTDPDIVPEEPQPVGPVVAARIAKAQAKVLRDGRAITPDSDPERLHDLRKDAKKLRYLLECFGGLLPAKPRKAFVAQLKELQENLGDHQDAEVQIAQLRDLAHDLHEAPGVDADVLLAMGRLSDQLDRRRRAEREAFAERFAAYDTGANRRALDELLATVSAP
jgi:CHAD domain-containing protein